MRGCCIFLILIAVWIPVFGQDGPKPFGPMNLGGPRGSTTLSPTDGVPDPASIYASRHEAAIAALKAANASAAAHQDDRAINLLLVAAKRDPAFGTVLYDLGVLCERSYRWGDAGSFFKLVPYVESSPELKKMAAEELTRVQLIGRLDATPEGKRRMEYDIALVKVLGMRKDPAVAVDAAARLAQIDSSRWEAPAVAGMLCADMERWTESLAALDTAVRLAQPAWRPQLMNAREIARRQAHYQAVVGEADQAWGKHEYGNAGKLYAEAWESNPSATALGLQAADGYLMDDQVAPAVECLSRLRQMGTDDESLRAAAMLEKLGAVSDRAREAAKGERMPKPPDSGENPAAIVAKNLENVASNDMVLVARPIPEMVEDKTSFIALSDAELTGPSKGYLSTESIYAQYKQVVPLPAALSNDERDVAGGAGADAAGSAPTETVPVGSTPLAPKALPPGPQMPNLDPR